MKPESQRIAIAEACGWKFYLVNALQERVWHKSINGKWTDTDVANFDQLPDYLNDLNAMHEAEKVLASRDEYVVLLRKACGGFNPVFATAAQRAEAFLKTLGLWKEEAEVGRIGGGINAT